MSAIRVFGLGFDECFESDFEKKCYESFLIHGTTDWEISHPSARYFWKTLIPQLSQLHPTVRHVTISLAVLQEPLARVDVRVALNQSTQDVQIVAIGHFNKSIQHFLQSSSSLRIEAKLTCCLLYNVLTTCLQRTASAAVHVNAADFLLKEHDKAVSTGQKLRDPSLDQQLAPIVHRQIVDASAYLDGFKNRFDYCGNPYDLFQHLLLRIQSTADITHATEIKISALNDCSLILLAYSVGQYLNDLSTPDLVSSLHIALAKFETFVEHLRITRTPEPSDSEEHRSFLRHRYRLEMHHRASLILASCHHGDELAFDSLTHHFEEVAKLAEKSIELDNQSIWCTSLGLLSPLFLVATKCRHYRIRHKSLKLLHDCYRVENAWSSCIATSLANTLIEQEEMMLNVDASIGIVSVAIRLCVQSVTFNKIAGEIILSCTVLRSGHPLQDVQHVVPYRSITLPDGFSELGSIPDRVIQAAGYSGPVLSTPRIPCHCVKPLAG